MEYLVDFLEYIYRDLSLEELHNDIREYDSINGDDYLSKNLSRFVIETDRYKDYFVDGFIHKYPSNYTVDEVNHLFDITIEEIQEFRFNSPYSISSRLNALDLITFTSVNLTNVVSNEFLVDFERLLVWNELLNTIDFNVATASALAYNNLDSSHCSYIPKHDFEELSTLISRGVGETHMHFNASGYSTDINWQLFNEKTIKAAKNKKFEEMIDFFEYKRKPLQFVENSRSTAYKLIKFIRYYLYDRVRSSDFFYLLNITLDSKKIRVLDESMLLSVLKALDDGDYSCYELKEEAILGCIEEDKDSFQQGAYNYVLTERNFLVGVFSLYYADELTPVERLVFNAYIVGVSIFKFSFIQDNKGMGFSKFKEYEKRKNFYFENPDYKILTQSVFDKYYREESVKLIEIRVIPKDRKSLRRLIRELCNANDSVYGYHSQYKPQLEKIKIALILHYIKESESIDLHGNNHRKQDFIELTEGVADKITDFFDKEIDTLENLKNKNDASAYYGFEDGLYLEEIVGVDSANYEMNCRPETLAVIFRKHMYEESTKSNLSITFHVGEEFMTLSNGLRAIDEYLEFFELNDNSRIGHAIALGINVRKYFSTKKNMLISSLQDYIDDLAWMYLILKEHHSTEVGLIDYLTDKLITNLSLLLSKDVDNSYIDKYSQSLKLRGDDPKVYLDNDFSAIESEKYDEVAKSLAYKINSHNSSHYNAFKDNEVRSIYFDYHYNNTQKKSGEKKITHRVDERFVSCVELCQVWLKMKVLNLGLTIEVNPSSNRKISYAESFSDIQLLGLNDNLLTHPNFIISGNNIRVTLNTDDSAVFQTSLYNEYSLIAASLVRDGYDRASVLNYLDEIRENSHNTTFID